MNLSAYFIRRPIFAGVLSFAVFLIGLLAMWRLPISEYPEVVPPTIVVTATYPGANPKTIAETVASPLEQEINGVENSLYMFSQATGDGVMTLTVTFAIGTDVDKAQVQVQNRVSQASAETARGSPPPRRHHHQAIAQPDDGGAFVFPERPIRRGLSPQLRGVAGEGRAGANSRRGFDVQMFGSGDYAMRVWLNPDKVAARNLTASDIVDAIREQNVQVAAGAIGQQPVSSPVNFELQINAKGRLVTPEEFGQIIVKTGPNGEKTLLKDVARIELSAGSYSLRSLLNNKTRGGAADFPNARRQRPATFLRCPREDGGVEKEFPRAAWIIRWCMTRRLSCGTPSRR